VYKGQIYLSKNRYLDEIEKADLLLFISGNDYVSSLLFENSDIPFEKALKFFYDSMKLNEKAVDMFLNCNYQNLRNFYKDILEKSLDFEEIKNITKQIKVEMIDNDQKFVLYFDKEFKLKIDENVVKKKFIQNLRKYHPEFKDDYDSIFSKLDDYKSIVVIKYDDFT
jgi:hypothetical protein